MKVPSSILLPLLVIPAVAGHGYVADVTINGKSFKGNAPNADTDPSIVRQISTTSPVKGANNPFVNCGQNAQLASLNGPANPGDALTFNWRASVDENWPHNTGPMLTYLASCGSETCDKFNSSSAKWFKIDQVAKMQNDNSTWLQQILMNGGVANVTLPKNIAPGNYIIRHEIIALHLANSKGGAEFYPSCSQLTIGGSGTDAPSDDELVSLPGAYSDLDPGIFVPNVFDPDNVYIFPGPLVASMAASTASKAFGASANTTVTSTGGTTTGSSSGSSGVSGSGSSSGNGTAGTSSPQSTGGSAGKTCRLKSGSSASANARRALRARPHTLSRIMRHLTPSLS